MLATLVGGGIATQARADLQGADPSGVVGVQAHERAILGVAVTRTDDAQGARVIEILPEGPAEKAGLTIGDVITAIGAQATPGPAEVNRAIIALKPESKVEITFLHEGQERKTQVTLAAAERMAAPRLLPVWLGILMDPRDDGVRIYGVHPVSPAARSDLRPGDVLRKIDNQIVDIPDDVYKALRDKRPGDTINVVVLREGQDKTVRVTLWPGQAIAHRDYFRAPSAEPAVAPAESEWQKRTDAELRRLNEEIRTLRAEVERLRNERSNRSP